MRAVATVRFTSNLARHIDVSPIAAAGAELRAVLEAAFAQRPPARGYVLDDQGALRKHVQIFIDGSQVRDRRGLSDPVGPEADVHIIQALSGG